MRTSIVRGLLLAVCAAVIVGLSQLFDLELDSMALLGVAVGGVLVLVPGGSWERLAGFGLGFVVAWLGYAMRAALLPDAASGRAITAFVVLVTVALIVWTTRDRLPLWSALLGVAAIVGAYEEAYVAAPSRFLDQSISAATSVLLAVALGHLAANLWPGRSAETSAHRSTDDAPTTPDAESTTPRTNLDEMFGGDAK